MFKKLALTTLTALTLSGGAALAAVVEGEVTNYSFSFEGPASGLYRGLLGLPRAALRADPLAF